MCSGWHLRHAQRLLCSGGVIAYPTEAVYGLGCDPLNPLAVGRILELKGRSWRKGLILIAANSAQIMPYIGELEPSLRAQVEATWPGPITWLLPADPAAPAWLCGEHPLIAVRVTAHPLAATLCRMLGGPIVSTSANPGGLLPARSPLAVRRYFGNGIDHILHAPLGGRTTPSEIRDGRSGTVVRAGQA